MKHHTCGFKGLSQPVYTWPAGKSCVIRKVSKRCFMGGMALCALLQQICNIPPWTDLDSISDYSSRHLRVFLSEPFRSITSVLFALVWINVWPQIVRFCFNVKLLWGGLLFCLLFPNAWEASSAMEKYQDGTLFLYECYFSKGYFFKPYYSISLI